METVLLQNRNIFASNCYILISDGEFSVVDPSVSYKDAVDAIPRIADMRPKFVLLTHVHADHFWEIHSYVDIGCKVLVSDLDSRAFSDRRVNCAELLGSSFSGYDGEFKTVSDGESIKFGTETLSALLTPGHTLGSVSYYADGVLFSGDTLFERGGYGRYDLPGGDASSLAQSLKRLLDLPGETVLYSGHGGITTIKETKQFF